MKTWTRAAIVAAAALLVACNPQPQGTAQATAAPSPTMSPLPPLNITGQGSGVRPIRASQQEGNRKVYQLIARSVQSHSAQTVGQATFQQAVVTFFDKDGTMLRAQAPTAVVDDKEKLVKLFTGVHARTSTGLRLTCDRLTYEQRTGMIHGEGHVHIVTASGEEATGNTFTSNVKLTAMVMR